MAQDLMSEPGPSPDEVVAFYRATVGEVHRYLAKLTAGDRPLTEDLTQETYAALVRARRAGRLPELSSAWLMTTARNAFLQRLRSHRREEARAGRITWDADGVIDLDQVITSADEANRLLRQLPPDQRTAIVLRYVDDLAVAEIARLLGRSLRATESLLARGTANIRRVVAQGAKEEQADA
jgi:RNA polymerase sigma-70 factor, ECF subfamily